MDKTMNALPQDEYDVLAEIVKQNGLPAVLNALASIAKESPDGSRIDSKVVSSDVSASTHTETSGTFREDTNQWYDDFVNYVKSFKKEHGFLPPSTIRLAEAVKLLSNCENTIEHVYPAINGIMDVGIRNEIKSQLLKIQKHAYKKEFRFHFSDMPGKISAASEFCSYLKQALAAANEELALEEKYG